MLKMFKIKSEERALALAALLFVGLLNALMVVEYFPLLSQLSTDYHSLARDTFHLSGFDAWTYSILSDWHGWEINIYRHPLLAVFCLIPFLLNQGLMALTGFNCAVPIMAVVEGLFGFYSVIFLYRILREVIGARRCDATLLTALFFTFAFIILTVMVPDHFNLSMCLMLVCLYIAGRKMNRRRMMAAWQTVLLFFFTAGISLNNGVKVFLAACFANGRKFFRPRFFLPAVILPAAVMWGIAVLEFQVWAQPLEAAAHQRMAARDKLFKDSVYQAFCRQHPEMDSTELRAGTDKVLKRLAYQQYVRNHTNPKIGRPMSKKGFMAWTDKETDRWRSVVENLFGESIQLHKANLLQDIMKDKRPMIVPYEKDYYYWVEGLLVLLFLAGIFFARRSRFFWLVFSWFAFDMVIYIGLGFGINEVYIMTSQWAFIIPIAMAYLLRDTRGWLRTALRVVVGVLALYLIVYNGSLILPHLS